MIYRYIEMGRTRMSVTLRDVARRAGVSPMAVSKVLNGRGSNVRVGKDAEEAIRLAANELGYRPNALARSLRRQKTETIGVLFEHFVSANGMPDYTQLLMDGIFDEAFKRGYSVTVCPKLSRIKDPGDIDDGRFDGVLWCKVVGDPAVLKALGGLRVPTVALNTPAPEKLGSTSFIICDNEGAMYQAVKHLADLGHRTIGFVYERSCADLLETDERRDGVAKACARLGIDLVCDETFAWGDFSEEFDDWWRGKPECTGVVCRSDRLAGGIVERAAKLGVQVPEDLSVVGFDSTAFCELTQPRLTSVHQPIEAMAAKATQVLIDTIEGRQEAALSLVYPCGLDVRDSTGRPSQRRGNP
ncbi:MAG: LacI family DNA-binding transcriptional regulator [Fimbriimonadaceae bacterium]|nr:LacI family DNA-binding transcriptional regulator [Fimbriimonadaceae bacterium]